MKKYGAFSGWFKLSGTRGRLSFLFSLLLSYLFLSLIIYVGFIFGFFSIFGALIWSMALESEKALSSSLVISISVIVILLILMLWATLCIEIQRLRNIGLSSSIIFLIIIAGYLLWFFSVRSIFNQSITNQFHWSDVCLFVIYMFELFMPPNRNTESKKVEVVSDSKSKRIDPKL